MTQVKAKKALGQHFLTDLNIAKRIADTIDKENLPEKSKAQGDIPVLEIGPGMGVLSQFLLATGRDQGSGTRHGKRGISEEKLSGFQRDGR